MHSPIYIHPLPTSTPTRTRPQTLSFHHLTTSHEGCSDPSSFSSSSLHPAAVGRRLDLIPEDICTERGTFRSVQSIPSDSVQCNSHSYYFTPSFTHLLTSPLPQSHLALSKKQVATRASFEPLSSSISSPLCPVTKGKAPVSLFFLGLG